MPTLFRNLLLILSGLLPAAAQVPEEVLQARDGGRFQEAIDRIEALPESRQRQADLLLLRGTLYAWLEEYERALDILEPAAERFPHYLDIHMAAGRVHAWRRDFAKAEARFARVLREDPDRMDARIMLARLAAWQRRFDEAERRYLAILEVDPNQPDALEGLGDIYLRGEDGEQARAFFERALAADPANRELEAKVEAARAITRWRLDTGFRTSGFDEDRRSDWREAYLSLRHALNRKTGIGLLVEWSRKFDLDDLNFQLGLDRRLHERLYSEAFVGWGPDADFSAETYLGGRLNFVAHQGKAGWRDLVVQLGARHSTYGAGDAQVLFAGFQQYLPAGLALTARAYLAHNIDGVWTDGWLLRVDCRPTKGFGLYAGASSGAESQYNNVVDASSAFETDAWFLGASWEPDPRWAVRADFLRELGTGDLDRNTVHLGLLRRF